MCKGPVVDRAGVSKLGKQRQWLENGKQGLWDGLRLEWLPETGASLVLYPIGKIRQEWAGLQEDQLGGRCTGAGSLD